MPEPWGKEELDAVLALLPEIESPRFKLADWPKFEPDADGVYQMPYPEYNPVVDRLLELLGGIHPYDPLPEDLNRDGLSPSSVFEVDDFSEMSVDQVRRYFSHCRRGEHFCDGYIEGQFRNGKAFAALRRLREIRRSMP